MIVLIVKQSCLKIEIVKELQLPVGAIIVQGMRKSVCIQNVQGRFSVHGGSVHASAAAAVNQAHNLVGDVVGYTVVRETAAGSARLYVKEKKPKKQKK